MHLKVSNSPAYILLLKTWELFLVQKILFRSFWNQNNPNDTPFDTLIANFESTSIIQANKTTNVTKNSVLVYNTRFSLLARLTNIPLALWKHFIFQSHPPANLLWDAFFKHIYFDFLVSQLIYELHEMKKTRSKESMKSVSLTNLLIYEAILLKSWDSGMLWSLKCVQYMQYIILLKLFCKWCKYFGNNRKCLIVCNSFLIKKVRFRSKGLINFINTVASVV